LDLSIHFELFGYKLEAHLSLYHTPGYLCQFGFKQVCIFFFFRKCFFSIHIPIVRQSSCGVSQLEFSVNTKYKNFVPGTCKWQRKYFTLFFCHWIHSSSNPGRVKLKCTKLVFLVSTKHTAPRRKIKDWLTFFTISSSVSLFTDLSLSGITASGGLGLVLSARKQDIKQSVFIYL
jgi:hypothetical protein